jgi:hypothetical protein
VCIYTSHVHTEGIFCLGKSVITGLKDGKKACAAVVSHIVYFKFIKIKSGDKHVLAWHVLRHTRDRNLHLTLATRV